MFEHQVLDDAIADRRHIVLPEGEEERILRAADILLRRNVADLTLLGDPMIVRAKAAHLGIDVSARAAAQPVRRGAARAVRAGVPPAARAQGHRPRGGPRHRGRRVVLRHDDGRARPRRRDGVRGGAHHRAHDPPGPRGHPHRARGVGGLVGVLHVPARPGARLRRLRGQPRPDRHPARRHRDRVGPHRRGVRRRAAGRDAVVLHRHLRQRHRRREGHRGDGDGPRARAGPARSRDRSSTTPRSTSRSRGPSCPTPPSPGGRRSSSSPTSTRATTPTRPCSGRPVRWRSDPVLQGLRKPVNDLSRGALVRDIVNTVAITAIQAQERS